MFTLHILGETLLQRLTQPSASPQRSEAQTSASRSNNTCRPTENLYFLRIPKTGSSTLANVLARRGLGQKLKISTTNGSSLSRILVDQPNMILYQHTEFERASLLKWMSKDIVYITLIRDPLAHLKSIFNYMKLAQRFNIGNVSDPFEEFLESIQKYDSSERPLTRNMITRPFGLEPRTERDAVHVIDMIERYFRHVLVQEYFDEGLILMKDKLCLRFEDLFYVSLKVMSYKQKTNVYTDKLRQKHEKWSGADYQIYNHFKNNIITDIENGGDEIQYQTTMLKNANAKIDNICKSMCRIWLDLKNNVIDDVTAAKMLNKRRSLKTPTREVSIRTRDCLLYTIDEQIMLNALEHVQKNGSHVTDDRFFDVLLLFMCKSNGLCKNETLRSQTFLPRFTRYTRLSSFIFPIQWCDTIRSV